jgi:phosphoribosylformimino-5-aminoimidazole carboxamide ribotide isomerase
MEILPAIDLLDGKCVRLYQGDYNQSQVYHEDPVAVAQQWQAQGASRLHLVDLDGAKAGEPINLTAIAAIVQGLNIPVQVGGGLRNRDRVKQLLALGVGRVILGTIAVEDPDLVGQLCSEFPGQIVVGIDARNGKVATRGWLETSSVEAGELAQRMEKLGAAAIIYTDIHRDGTMTGPNLDALRELADQLTIPVIASGGVSQLRDLLNLLSLESHGVNGVIIGKALYTGDIQLEDAIRAIGPERWQDVPPADFPRLA